MTNDNEKLDDCWRRQFVYLGLYVANAAWMIEAMALSKSIVSAPDKLCDLQKEIFTFPCTACSFPELI